jgi:glycosyltransferase involved in cell wall biosynthesis
MHLVHLTASTFFGGPERQMLGLAGALPGSYRSTYLSFSEHGRCRAFIDQVNIAGFDGYPLRHDTPDFRAAIRELTRFLGDSHADVLISHGYKSNLLGRIAARRIGIPVVAVSRGWTAENLKVRLYESLDRFNLRSMDAVVCVSDGQARRVRRAGVPSKKITTIHNAARLSAFRTSNPADREGLRRLAGCTGTEKVVLAAGRLSPEKGFSVLVEAADVARRAGEAHRFILFGEGVERPLLERRIDELGLHGSFVLAGFRDDLDRWLPWADMVVLPSFTEGLPNVALEAAAAGVPVVATAVGGTPEVVHDNVTGYLVPAGQPTALAERILQLCRDDDLRKRLGEAGHKLMLEQFSFEAQASAYLELLSRLVHRPVRMAA